MITTIEYKFGFEYKNVKYVWKNKKLFRLPYTSNNRNYSLKEIPLYCFKTTLVANIQRTKLTIRKLKSLTEEVNWKIDVIENFDYPF
jgi:hypothetical protein